MGTSAALLLVQLLSAAVASAQKDPPDLPNRSVIVHLFEWKFSDIAMECEQFLAPNGYGAIQTSPVADHLSLPEKSHPWWERYQPMSYKIISRSGDEDAFTDMVKRCNDVGIRTYVDVVINHMTGQIKEAKGMSGSSADGVSRDYPAVPFGPKDFNELCDILTYKDAKQVRDCALNGLNDLNQRSDYVRRKIINFLNHLIDLGVAGFRVDAAKHMWPQDLEYIYSQLKNLSTQHGFGSAQRPFIYQEVIDFGGEGIQKTEYSPLARVTEFKYGAELGRAFRGRNLLKWLVNFGPEWGLLPSEDAVVFIDNHDNQRGHGAGGADILTHSQPRLYKMAVGFMLAHPYGYPRVMSSYNFNDSDAGPPSSPGGGIADVHVNMAEAGGGAGGWVCEHRWPPIASMVAFRNAVNGTDVNHWWDNGNNQIAFGRGTKGFVVFNGENSDLKYTIETSLPEGTYCDIISGEKEGDYCTGNAVEVDRNGNAVIDMLQSDEGILAVHVGSKLYK